MTGNAVEIRQGVEAMASFDAKPTSPLEENEGGRNEIPKHHTKLNGVTEGVDSGNNAPKPDTLKGGAETNSRTSSQGQEGAGRGGSRGNTEAGGLLESMDAPDRLRVEGLPISGRDSGTKSTDDEIEENERLVENSMFKQIKFENGTAVAQSGLTDADDQAEASRALAAVMEVYGNQKKVVGQAAEFPGAIGMGNKNPCRVCDKPETAKHTIVCDKCQHSYHLSCVNLKPKRAVDIENEHWQCEACGPEVGWQYWPLGRVTPLHDRKQADSKLIESTPHLNSIEHHAALIPYSDAAVEDISTRSHLVTTPATRKFDEYGKPRVSGSLWLRTREQEVVVSLPGGNPMTVRRGPGRPKKDPNAVQERKDLSMKKFLREKTTPNTVVNLGVRDLFSSGEQPSVLSGNSIGALQPSAQTPILPPQIPFLDVNDRLTSANKMELLGDPAIVPLVDYGLHSDGRHSNDPGVMLEDLRQFIASMNGTLEKGWEVIRKRRPSNPQIFEKIYISPEKQKFRSRLAVARFLGLSERTHRESRMGVQPAAQRLEIPAPIDNLSFEGFRSSTEMELGTRSAEPQEVVESRIEEKVPVIVKENRSLPPSGELLKRRIPVELVGDTIQVWEFLCRFSDILDLKSPITYGDLEIGLVNIGPPAAEDCPSEPAIEGTGPSLEIVNGLEQHISLSGEAGGLPQSTIVKETRDPATDSTELCGDDVSGMSRAVASSDGSLNESFVMISKTHITLLKLLLTDLQNRITGTPVVSIPEEPKKKGPKPAPTAEYLSDLPMNEVTWPELLRRYLITHIEVEKYGDLTALRPDERRWLLRCLQGDGGIPCGALYTVVGVESDAQVLAEAEKELNNRLLKASQAKEESGPVDESDALPDWVEALRPVAKMATNVGSRIRIKVKEALELGPPEWARERLEWSISKVVFKSNASGPTKKAVVEVLSHFDVSPACESPTHKTKPRKTVPSADQLMQRCRVVLRTVADADKTDTFSILIDGPEGHGSRKLRGMVARPLDFRTIDARLAAGAYGGSVDAFAEDVRQIWRNVESLQKGGEVMELATHLSLLFEDLLQKQVINFMSGVPEVKAKEPKAAVALVAEEGAVPIDAPLTRSATAERPEDKLQTAPWQDNDTCRVCGVDEDYESIMLCDRCDAEYHTYCLNPPLENVPEGNWFCPECVALDKGFPDRHSGKDVEGVEPESLEGEEEQFPGERKDMKEALGESPAQCLLKQIESNEYWQLGLAERVHILKFLCNESLETTHVRTHLEKTLDLASDLQQQLGDLLAQRQEADVAAQGRQKKDALEGLKTRSQIAKGTEASSVDSLSSRLRHHSSGDLSAEDIRPGSPRTLDFDVDRKEFEHTTELPNTVKGSLDSAKLDSHDVVAVNNDFHEEHESKKRRNDELIEGGSKRAKVEVFSKGGEPQVEGTNVTSTTEQNENLGAGNTVLTSDLPEGQTVGEVDGSDSPGSKNISADEGIRGLRAESERRVSLRSLENPGSSGTNAKIGVAAAGLPPRTPKRKMEPTSSSETLKKSRTDGTGPVAPALGEVIDDPNRGEGLSDPKSQVPAMIHTRSMDPSPSSELSKLDAEILKVELKLFNTTLRREHLGTDDIGRNYWALSGSNQTPMLVVSECEVIGSGDFEPAEESHFLYVEQSGSGQPDGELLQSDHTLDLSKELKTRWWSYSNETAIDSLVAWLSPRVKAERALRASIFHWRETVLAKFHEILHNSNLGKLNKSLSGNFSGESLRKDRGLKRFPSLKATSILHMRYGSSSFSDRAVYKKSAMPTEGRVIRCSCLEPLWKYKWHCHACHETYESSAELESHRASCPDSVIPHSSGKKQKGIGKLKNNLTPVKGKKKSKLGTPKKDGTRRVLEREDSGVDGCEENLWIPEESTEPPTLSKPPTLQRPSTRSKIQATSHVFNPDDASGDDPYAFGVDFAVGSAGPVDDAFFLSDFQDGNPGVGDVEPEEFRMGFGSYSALLQDDEWEANLRPDRSELKRKKQNSGKKSSKQPPAQGTSELALANFDYASLPMTFATPDSTRDRINQIGCIADQGPTFAPALHFAPAFDPSLKMHPNSNESPTDAVEFPGSSQNGSPVGEFHAKDFVEGGLDAVSWFDPHASGELRPDVVFVPDTEQPEFEWGELVGLPKMEYAEEHAPLVGGVNVKIEAEGPSNDGAAANESRNADRPSIDGGGVNANPTGDNTLTNSSQVTCTLNATVEESAAFSVDEMRPTSNIVAPSALAAEALPAQNLDVQPESVAAATETAVVPSSVPSMKKQSKKFAAPESSLRPLVGEEFGVVTGLKMRLLDMEAAMGSEALVPPKSSPYRRRAWRSLVKSAQCIYELTKALILLEQMVRPDCLKRTWCHWSSLSSAARSATLSTLALRIYCFDDAVTYKKDKLITEDVLRPSTLKKSQQQKKKVQVQVPLPSSKKKKAVRAS